MMRKRRLPALLPAALVAASMGGATGHTASPSALLVCNGSTHACPAVPAGTTVYTSIQDAVNAANPGDWVLVWPGDYHEKSGNTTSQKAAGVYITKNGLHLRGMDRNLVVIDGTNPNSNGVCSSNAGDQDPNGGVGRDGVVVAKATGTWIENFTVCNYLGGSSGHGNEVWWNGGDSSGKTSAMDYWGNYLTASSTYYPASGNAMPQYGIFVSNINSPGGSSINHTYASNMADSSYYIGACSDCNTVLNDGRGFHSALGYSGTNSGGRLVIENSEFADSRAGIVPNTLNNDDAPSPNWGQCPGSQPDAIGYTASCEIFENNVVHDNNNPNVPGAGIAGVAPVGTGIELVATNHVTVQNNTIYNQGGWGIAVHDYPDTETPPASGINDCNGGIPGQTGQFLPFCYYQGKFNSVQNNTLHDNGGFNNPTNGDLGLQATGPGNCFGGNTDPAGLTSDPPAIQTVDANCDGPTVGDSGLLTAELVCASGLFGQCPGAQGVDSYPQSSCTGNDCLVPMPSAAQSPTMSDPCADDAAGESVPANPWCPYLGPSSGNDNSHAHIVERSTLLTGVRLAEGALRLRAW